MVNKRYQSGAPPPPPPLPDGHLGQLTAQVRPGDIEAHSSIIVLLLEGDSHVRAGGAVGRHKDVPRLLVGAHVARVEGLPIGEVAHSQQGVARSCGVDSDRYFVLISWPA